MGGNSTKANSVEEDEFNLLLPKIFDVNNLKDIGPIDKSTLEKVWSRCLTDELISLYSTFVEHNNVGRKKIEDKRVFYNIYSTLVKGTNAEIAGLLCLLFNLRTAAASLPESCRSFSIEELIRYASYLFSSFLKCLKYENDEALNSWLKAGVGLSKDVEETVTKYLLKELMKDNSLVSLEELEVWLFKCPLFLMLQSNVVKKAFCRYDKMGLHQNQLPTPDFGQINKTRLDVHHIMYVTNNLVSELKLKWRLLYSSKYSGQSWVIFLKSILDQGPTVIFIWDRNDQCFGGFASSSWSLSPRFYGDDNCFLFTLLPSLNKFESTNYNKNFQYVNTAQATFPNGLGMGGQMDYWGLFLDSSMKFGKVSVSCSTFANYKQPTTETFEIEDIEVWGLGEKPISLEPEGRQRSVLDSQTDAKAVLEMMGKSQVSQGLREPADDD